jgi:hypothetical protein
MGKTKMTAGRRIERIENIIRILVNLIRNI